MQTIAVFVACLAVASAASSYAVRTPTHDSAVIESHRLGGSFAYSTSEGHAYGVVSPVVQNVVSPVATSYSHSPIATSYSHSPVATSYSAVAGYPYTYNTGYPYTYNTGVPVVNSHLGNVAVVRSGNVVSGAWPSVVV